MKTNIRLLLLAALMTLGSLLPSFVQAGNTYHNNFSNYTVTSMGNGVLHFSIPIWVYGKGKDRTYYLEPHSENNNNTNDSYIWYSEYDGQQRGSENVHRVVSFGGTRKSNYDEREKGGKGFVYVLTQAGTIVVTNTHDGAPLTVKENDPSHWIVGNSDDQSTQNRIAITRTNTYYTDHAVILEMDWYVPEHLQGKTFYLGVNSHKYRVGDNESYEDYFWQWSGNFKGGDIPRSPMLQQPFFYTDVTDGKKPQGKAAMIYVTFHDPISYHTSLNPSEEIKTIERSDKVIVQMYDTVQPNVTMNFHVWIDSTYQLSQRLVSNSVYIPAYHNIYNLKVSGLKNHIENGDKWLLDYRKKELTWEVHHPEDPDIITGDMFEIQRAYNSDYSDAETIGVIPIEYDSLATDTLTDIQTYRYVDSNEEERWNPVEKSYRLYYRVRRASSSTWGWTGNNYASFVTYDPETFPEAKYKPMPFFALTEAGSYTKDPDFENNRQLNFTINLFEQVVRGLTRTESDPGVLAYYWDKKQQLIIRKILVELNDTIIYSIPTDSIFGALDRLLVASDSELAAGKVQVRFTDNANTPCVHYRYEAYIDTSEVLVQGQNVTNLYSALPLNGPDIYYTEAANIHTFRASKQEYSDGVLLAWSQTEGDVGTYTIKTRPAGSDTAWTVLVDGLENSWYKDRKANPFISREWEYRLVMNYTCNGNIIRDSVETIGSRNPYGKVSGVVHYADGTACPGITVEAVRTSTGEMVQRVETAENGVYQFDSLLYGEGYAYAITPTSTTAQFQYNHTNSPTASITLGLDNCIATNVNFVNISSVRVSGRVLYENSTVPVRDVHFRLNGIPVKSGASLYKTDASGNFEFSVPQNSPITIQAFKDGHVFDGDGFIRDIKGDSVLTLAERLPGVRIYDQTKVRLIGRIVGGRIQSGKPLGFGLSRNNLGDDLQMVFELEGDNISQIVHLQSDPTISRIDTTIRHDIRTATGIDSVGSTKVEYYKKRIIIRPDINTGEYYVDLFPVKYKITQATALGYATLYAAGKTGETLDLTEAPLHKHTNVEEDKEVDYNETYSITYHSPLSITCKQMRYGMELDYYGEETMTRKNILNENVEIPLVQKQADGTYTYLFGAPVFDMNTYQFLVSAHEDYYYNNDTTSLNHEEVRIQGGKLKIYNGMQDTRNTTIETKELDSNGEVFINVPIDYVSFVKSGEDALRVLDLSVEYEGEFVESQAIRAYVTGDKMKGQDFTASTHGKVVLLDILRDPPGSGSSAFIESGTSYGYDFNVNVDFTFGMDVSIGYGMSLNYIIGSWAGVGGGMFVGSPFNVSNVTKLSLPIKGEYVYKHSGSYTFATSERIATGADPLSVGADADIFIGATQNVLYGLLDAVKPIDSLTYVTLAPRVKNGDLQVVAEGFAADGKKYYLVIGTEIGADTYINSTFTYTQDYIENTLLYQLRQRRDALLMTGDSASVAAIAAATGKPAYWSKVDPDDAHYADNGYYVQIVPDNNKVYDDEVAAYNRQIVDWVSLLILNEKEKVAALRGSSGTMIGNWALGGTTSVSHNETYQYHNTYASKFFYPGTSPGFNIPAVDLTNIAGLLNSSMEKALQGALAGANDGDPIDMACTTTSSKWSFSITPILNLDYSRAPESKTTGHTKTAGFTLSGDDFAYESLDISVYRLENKKSDFNEGSSGTRDFVDADDYVYGSYVYFLNGGATRCPWEGPDSTRFFLPKVPLSAGTLKLENPKLDINVHERSNVPVDQAAVFNLRLTNEGEMPYGGGNGGIKFTLQLLEGTNPKGAKIFIDGAPLLEEGRQIRLVRGEIINKTVEVYAGEGYDFEDITLTLISPCSRKAQAQCTFSVHYMPVACPVSISAPHDKWIMNTLSPQDSTGWYLPVVIDGFDINYKNFDHIEFQYKLSTHSDDAWVSLCSYYADDSLYNAASGNKEKITGGRIENVRFYGERDPMEQQYDLRAVAFCRFGTGFITRASAVMTGIKDTRPPRVFGRTEPENAILSVDETLHMRFNEPIAGNYLDEDNNFQILGYTNSTGITTGISLHFDDSEQSYAQTKVVRSLSDKSFTIDMLVRPTNPEAEATFFSYETQGGNIFSFGKTADNRLMAHFNTTTIYSSPLPELMTAFTRVVLVYDRVKRRVRFYAGTKDLTDDAASVPPVEISFSASAPITIAKGFEGNMMEVRIWTKVLSTDEIAETYMRRLTGYELELMAYYPMNEGIGTTLTDNANGATLYTYGAEWEHQKGISLHLNDQQKARLDHTLMSRTNKQDETIMFWFKTDGIKGTIFSAGRMDDTHGTEIAISGYNLVLRNYAEEWIISGNYANNEWHHFVLTINRTFNTTAIYVDDQLKHSFASTRMGEVSGDMYFGGNGFQGNIDDFVIFEQALPKSLLESYGTTSPVGNEMGIIAYLPFCETRESDNGIMTQVFSVNDQRIITEDGKVVNHVQPLVLSVTSGSVDSLGDEVHSAPVQNIGQLTKMNFDWSFNNDELLININMLNREINKQTLYVTVRDVEDLNGNPMVSPVTWTTFVDYNALKWAKREMKFYAVYGEESTTETLTMRVINHSGKRHNYTIESLPSWLSVNAATGSVNPIDEVTLTFSANTEMAPGVYSDLIYLTDEEGLSEPLRVELTIEALPPYGDPDVADCMYNMSLCAQVVINEISRESGRGSEALKSINTDPNDIVYAFCLNQLVGKEHITFNDVTSTSKVFLTVYGNEDMDRKPVRFQLWQASTGKVYDLVPNRDVIFAHGFVYNCGDVNPLILATSGSLMQTINLSLGWNWISTHLDLSATGGKIADCMTSSDPWIEGDQIKNPANCKFSSYSKAADTFIGELTHLHHSQIYMVYSEMGNLMRISGDQLSEDSMLITVRGNGQWTPMPCLFDQTTPLAEALSGYYDNASPGDLIKSHDRFATFSADRKWEGNLNVFRPGEGYLFRRMGTGSVTIPFFRHTNNAPGKMQGKNLQTAKETFTNPYAAANMTMIAAIGDNHQSPIIMVYVGDELAGVAEPVDSLYYITIQSDKTGELRFATEDGTELYPDGEIDERLPYVPDSHYGTLRKPVLLTSLAGETVGTSKRIENDHVIIIRNGERYDVTGKKLKR